MKRVLSTAAVVLAYSACFLAPDGDRTVIAQFDRVPSSADQAALERVGGRVTGVITIVRAAKVRTANGASDYYRVPGVVRVKDFGGDEDPWVSVGITVADSVIQEDLDYVEALGPSGWFGRIGDSSSPLMGAVLRLSKVDQLGLRSRFVAVELGGDDNRPG